MMEIENNLASNGYTPILICASSTSCHFQSAGLFRVSVCYIIVRVSWAYSLLQGVLPKKHPLSQWKTTHSHTKKQRQYMIFTLYISHILVLKRNYWQSQGSFFRYKQISVSKWKNNDFLFLYCKTYVGCRSSFINCFVFVKNKKYF